MDFGLFQGVFTAVLLALFVGLIRWAWSARRKKDFERAARLPLDDDSEKRS